MVDEELAVEVVGLVLHTGAEVAFAFDAHGVSVEVKAFKSHAAGTLHLGAKFRNGKTAFVLFGKLGVDDRHHRVDEDAEVLRKFGIIVREGHIDDDHALEYADLGSGNTYATHGLQGIEHILSEGTDLVVDLSNRLGLLGEQRMGVLENGTQHVLLRRSFGRSGGLFAQADAELAQLLVVHGRGSLGKQAAGLALGVVGTLGLAAAAKKYGPTIMNKIKSIKGGNPDHSSTGKDWGDFAYTVFKEASNSGATNSTGNVLTKALTDLKDVPLHSGS